MLIDCPIECPCDNISICIECDYYQFKKQKLEKEQKKCYNMTNGNSDKVTPNQSYPDACE